MNTEKDASTQQAIGLGAALIFAIAITTVIGSIISVSIYHITLMGFLNAKYFFRLSLSYFHLNWHDLSILINTFSFPTNLIFSRIQIFTQ